MDVTFAEKAVHLATLGAGWLFGKRLFDSDINLECGGLTTAFVSDWIVAKKKRRQAAALQNELRNILAPRRFGHAIDPPESKRGAHVRCHSDALSDAPS